VFEISCELDVYVERVTRIELALSAWESVPSGPVTWPDLRVGVSASDRDGPLVTGANGPLMARLPPLAALSFVPCRFLNALDMDLPSDRACFNTARRPSALSLAAYTGIMSVQREELLRLVEELPEEEVPAVLDDVRRHLRSVRERPWPPTWFGAGEASTDDVAARSEDLLRDGFGRSA